MPVHADAMSGAVRQAGQLVTRPEAFRFIEGAHGIVHGSRRRAQLSGSERTLLAFRHDIPHPSHVVGHATEHEAARDVRGIAANAAAAIDQHHLALAHGLRLGRAVRIGRRLAQQYQPVARLAAQRRSCGIDQRGDVTRGHTGADALPGPTLGRQRHVTGRLHQCDFGRGLHHAAGAHHRVGRRDPRLRQTPRKAITDKEAHRLLDADGGRGAAGLAQRFGDECQRVLVLLPHAHVGLNAQTLADRGLFEKGRNDHRLAAGRDDGRCDPLAAPPLDAGEIVQARSGLDDDRRHARLGHQRLRPGDASGAFGRVDRFEAACD